jgi:hypothetical protein
MTDLSAAGGLQEDLKLHTQLVQDLERQKEEILWELELLQAWCPKSLSRLAMMHVNDHCAWHLLWFECLFHPNLMLKFNC